MEDKGSNDIHWKEEYIVGIQMVDEQHQELMRLTNELYAVCLAGHSTVQQQFINILRRTADYVTFHFSSEEKFMRITMYPDLESHKKEHDVFVEKVIQTLANSQKFIKKRKASYNFVVFLREWILDHIDKKDKAFGIYIMHLKEAGSLPHNIEFKV